MTEDALQLFDPAASCPECGGTRNRRRACSRCANCGFAPVSLRNLWRNCSAFLVCGGPSLRDYPVSMLRQRGVASLGINNASAYAPVAAATFGDPRYKMHPSIMLDPGILTFVPHTQLRKHLRFKLPDKTFRMSTIAVADCPATYGMPRSGRFCANTFFDTWFAHWGYGGKNSSRPYSRLCSTLLGIRLLYYLGVRRIFLLGVDHSRPDKADGYAWGERGSGGLGAYDKMDRMYRELLPHLSARGVTIYNCNADSACQVFPTATFSEAIAECRGLIQRQPFDLRDWYANGIRKEMSQTYPQALSPSELREVL